MVYSNRNDHQRRRRERAPACCLPLSFSHASSRRRRELCSIFFTSSSAKKKTLSSSLFLSDSAFKLSLSRALRLPRHAAQNLGRWAPAAGQRSSLGVKKEAAGAGKLARRTASFCLAAPKRGGETTHPLIQLSLSLFYSTQAFLTIVEVILVCFFGALLAHIVSCIFF